MLDGTYAGLQASVADFMNRADLVATVPDFIAMAEAQMNRDLRAADMIAAITLAVSTASTALPADFNGMISFELPPGVGAMRYEKPDGVRALRANVYTSAGTPLMWSIVGTNLEVCPAPSGTFNCQMAYYQRIPALLTNSTNWLLSKHPDAYLYGALLQSAPYLKDDARVQVWGQLYQQAIGDIMGADARVSFGHGFVPPYRSAAYPQGNDAQPAPAPAGP